MTAKSLSRPSSLSVTVNCILYPNGYVESFNGKLRDELINREVFTTLLEAKMLIENWRRDYNEVRSHSSLGYRPPAPEAIQPALTPAPLTQKVVSSLGAGQV